MASQGPLYPGTVTTETGPSGDNDWTNASNVGADDGSEAQITAATYDAGDHSFRLKAQNFGFSVSGTIDGIVVEIERRDFAGDAQDQEVRLYNGAGALVGDDKQTATSWPTTIAIATYGGTTDTWNAGLAAADINDPDFGVALIALANSANTDIGVDFIRVTVHYTPPAGVTGTGAGTSAASSAFGAAKEAFIASGAAVDAASTAAGSGSERFLGPGAVTDAASTGAGSGTVTAAGITGTGAGTSAASSASGAALLRFLGTLAATDAASTASGQAVLMFAASGAGTDALSTADGSALLRFLATGAGTDTASSGSGSGVLGGAIAGSGAGTSAASSGAGTGSVSGDAGPWYSHAVWHYAHPPWHH